MASKFYTWRLTVSPKEDIEQQCVHAILGYLTKKCRYLYVVVERSSKEHLHACLCYKQPIEKKHIAESVWKHVAQFHPTAVKKVAVDLHVMYDHSWYDDYLKKDLSTREIIDTYVRDEVTKCFPTREEQDALMEAVTTGVSTDAKDPFFAKLEADWIDYSPDCSYELAVKFLHYRMYVERSMKVIVDQRRLHQIAWCLFQYRSRSVEISCDAKRFGHLMDGSLADVRY